MERLDQLMKRIDKFNKDRDWDKFHSPSNLSKSISIEANELLECFQWSDTDYDIEAVKEELADVMNYCIQMSMVLGVDIIDILNSKMDKSEKKEAVCGDLLAETIFIIFTELAGFARRLEECITIQDCMSKRFPR